MSYLKQETYQIWFIPEVIGRIPLVVGLSDLSIEQMKQVLIEPKNALVKQYSKLFKLDDVDLEFTESALQITAEMAIERKSGARGLKSIIEELLLDVMFELPNIQNAKKCVINDETIQENLWPMIYDSDGSRLDVLLPEITITLLQIMILMLINLQDYYFLD